MYSKYFFFSKPSINCDLSALEDALRFSEKFLECFNFFPKPQEKYS